MTTTQARTETETENLHERRRTGSALLVLGLVLASACATPGGPRGGVRPTNPDEEAILAGLEQARARRNLRPPTWVQTLEPIAQEGAEQLAGGALPGAVTKQVWRKALDRFGHRVWVWWFVADDLHNLEWPPRMLSGRTLGVAAGVALMRTTAPGRYAIIVILPEPGSGFHA